MSTIDSEKTVGDIQDGISRRDVITSGVALAVAGGATLAGSSVGEAAERAPAVLTGTQKGRRFRAFIAFPGNPPGVSIQESKARVETVTMTSLAPDRVVVRTEAAQVCYSIVGQATAGVNATVESGKPVQILGHSAVGIVEAVGTQVRRVQVGDRVMLANTPQCGVCYNCLRERPDRCVNTGDDDNNPAVIGSLADGTPVAQQHDRGGLAELVITTEDYCIPIFYDISPVELAMLGCPAAVGLGCTLGFVAPVTVGSDVCILGCGPLGLSAVQGARLKGASQIIAVEPIAARRAMAQQFGATTVIDPNVDTEHLVDKVRELCKGPSTRTRAGGRPSAAKRGEIGPEFVVEAVGGDFFPPKAEAGPDPKGLISLQWAWDLCSPTGHVSTVSVHQSGNFTVPAPQWSNGAKNHHPGNFNGVATLRDMQIFARLVERGQFNAKAMTTATFPLERTKEALQLVSDRNTIAAILVFT
jgi:S-(hydroxymethyl)glutathione dehydrogenase/alcohol dehydrogenase